MFLLHVSRWFVFIGRVCLTHPVLAFFFSFFLSRAFLLHIPCWLYFYVGSFSYTSHAGFVFLNLGSFSYTSHAGFIFIWGVSLKHPMLPLYFFREFSDGSHAGFFSSFFKIWGVSLTRLALVRFYRESLSYTSRAGFFLFFFSF